MKAEEVEAFALAADGALARALASEYLEGEALDAAAQEPRATLVEAAPRTPIEALVLRSMSLAAAQQRNLIDLATRTLDPKKRQRYVELSLRASREVMRAAHAWHNLRTPPAMLLGPGSQANVVGGNQVIHRDEGRDAE